MGWDKYNKDIRQNVNFNYKQTTDFKIRRFLCKNKFLISESQNVGCLVDVKTTPTHPTSPVNKRTPIVFHPFLVGVDEKFLKIYQPSTWGKIFPHVRQNDYRPPILLRYMLGYNLGTCSNNMYPSEPPLFIGIPDVFRYKVHVSLYIIISCKTW